MYLTYGQKRAFQGRGDFWPANSDHVIFEHAWMFVQYSISVLWIVPDDGSPAAAPMWKRTSHNQINQVTVAHQSPDLANLQSIFVLCEKTQVLIFGIFLAVCWSLSCAHVQPFNKNVKNLWIIHVILTPYLCSRVHELHLNPNFITGLWAALHPGHVTFLPQPGLYKHFSCSRSAPFVWTLLVNHGNLLLALLPLARSPAHAHSLTPSAYRHDNREKNRI